MWYVESREESMKRRSRIGERFVYLVLKIKRFYHYQTWLTHFVRNSRDAQMYVGEPRSHGQKKETTLKSQA